MSLYASGIVRIISEPQIKFFDSGTCVCNFGGGISEGKDKDGNYINNAIDVEVWGKGGQMIADNCKKRLQEARKKIEVINPELAKTWPDTPRIKDLFDSEG